MQFVRLPNGGEGSRCKLIALFVIQPNALELLNKWLNLLIYFMGFGFCFLMIPRHVKIVFAAPMCFRICVVFRNLRFFECSFQAAGNRRKAAFVVGDGYGKEKKKGEEELKPNGNISTFVFWR